MKYIFTIVLTFLSLYGLTQKYDYHWISGIRNYTDISPTIYGNQLSFETDSIQVQKIRLNLYMRGTPITISNKEGELQFYTNGNVVASAINDQIMSFGKGFNEGSVMSDFGTDLEWNLDYTPDAYYIIPDAYAEGVFYMIHGLINYAQPRGYLLQSDYLQISKIDMNANLGRGRVVYKNRNIYNQVTGYTFSVVQHGNGKDWWVLLTDRDGDKYYNLLLHKDSIIIENIQEVPTFNTFERVRADSIAPGGEYIAVSNDGNTLVDNYDRRIKRVYDFDRCTGDMTLIDTFHVSVDTLFQRGRPSLWGSSFSNLCFSPNNRFVYGWGVKGTYQYDLEAEQIGASKVAIGGVPFYVDEFLVPSDLSLGYVTILPRPTLGPDGKMYILQRYTHRVIEFPNEKGHASGYCEAPCIDFPEISSINKPELFSPTIPNYRMGVKLGSTCDTIVSVEESDTRPKIKIYPNPSTGPVRIELSMQDWSNQEISVQIFNALGVQVYRHDMTAYSFIHDVPDGILKSGVYIVYLFDQQQTVASERLVVIK